jgi:hypothetical protein
MLHDRVLLPRTAPRSHAEVGHLLRQETAVIIIMTLEDAPKIREGTEYVAHYDKGLQPPILI